MALGDRHAVDTGRSLAVCLVLVEDERHLGAGRDAVAGQLLVLGTHLVLFEGRVTRLVNREQDGIDRVALGVANAARLFETNLHSGVLSRPIGTNRSIRTLSVAGLVGA